MLISNSVTLSETAGITSVMTLLQRATKSDWGLIGQFWHKSKWKQPTVPSVFLVSLWAQSLFLRLFISYLSKVEGTLDSLPMNMLQFLLGNSLWRQLRSVMFPVGSGSTPGRPRVQCAQKTSKQRCLLIRCPNYLKGLFLTWRSSSSTNLQVRTWALYVGNSFQLLLFVTLLFKSWSLSHIHRLRLECGLSGKLKALPSDSLLFLPQQSDTALTLVKQGPDHS